MHSKNRKTRLARGLAFAAVGAIAATACDADREDFISPIGDVILDMGIGPNAPALPGGSMTVDALTLGDVDLSRSGDGLDRAGAFHSEAIRGVTGCPTEEGACPGPDYLDGVRTADTDPRSPGLLPSSASPTIFGIVADSVFGVPFFLARFVGLEASTQYFVALERLATQVSGISDHAAILLENSDEFGTFATDPATDPDDALVPLDGSGGTSNGSNPYVIGSFTTDGSGTGFPQIAFTAAAGEAYQATNLDDGTGLGANQYNYIVVYEGSPLAAGMPVLRTQIGQDVTPANEPIPTSFAPFPTEPLTELADLSAATCCALVASELTVELETLVAVNGVYQAWLLNDATGEVVPVAADLVATEPGESGDVEVESGTGVGTFSGGIDRTITLTITDAGQGRSVSDFTHVFVTIEGASATTPSSVQPVWVRYLEVDPDDPADAFGFAFTTEDDVTFGTFDTGVNPTPFVASGFGQGAFTGEQLGTADYFRARFRNLPLPPVGYYYEGFMRQLVDGAVASEATTGELTTEFDEGFASLRDVDIDRSISVKIGSALIIESANRATVADVGAPFETFEDYVLTLRPKAAASATSGYDLLLGEVPEPLKAREEAPE